MSAPDAGGTEARSGTAAEHAEQAWRVMGALVTELNDRRAEVVVALGMSFGRSRALRRLARAPMSLRELAAQLGTDAPYATVVVDDLERRGLVERRPDPDDRRRKIVAVTPEGAELARTAETILTTPPAALVELPEDDLAELRRILDAVLERHRA